MAKHGWFSQELFEHRKDLMARRYNGLDHAASLYEDVEGNGVLVTEVTLEQTPPETEYDDLEYCGEVVRWLGRV